MGFPRQEYYSGLLFPFPEDLPDPGIKPGFPALQADSLPSEPRGETLWLYITCQKRKRGNSLAIQQLGLCALIAEGIEKLYDYPLSHLRSGKRQGAAKGKKKKNKPSL